MNSRFTPGVCRLARLDGPGDGVPSRRTMETLLFAEQGGVLARRVLLALVAAALLAAASCSSASFTWVGVAEFKGLRVDATSVGNPVAPAFDLHRGAVRVTGTVTFERAAGKAFGLGLVAAGREPRAYSFDLDHHEVGSRAVETFEGVVDDIEAGEYALVLMGGPAVCDVTVYQRD